MRRKNNYNSVIIGVLALDSVARSVGIRGEARFHLP